jgi:cytochrome c553
MRAEKSWLPAFAGMTMGLMPALVWADGKDIALHGNQTGAPPCAACHGVDGAGNASIGAPRLAGLPAAAISAALTNYAAGHGGNAIMQRIAGSLSAAEMSQLAAYFSTLAAPKP